jgi:hypothetical protein
MNLESSDYNQVFNTFLNYYKEHTHLGLSPCVLGHLFDVFIV